MIKPINLKVNYTKPEYSVAETQFPVFSWGCEDLFGTGRKQSGYRIVVTHASEVLWDSGVCRNDEMQIVYGGAELPSGAIIRWELQLIDDSGIKSNFIESYFKTACFAKP